MVRPRYLLPYNMTALNFFYDNLVTAQECQEMANQMRHYAKIGRLNKGYGDLFTENTEGVGKLPTTYSMLTRIDNRIQQDYGHLGNVVFTHTYSRIYHPGSFLKVHVDRPGLDVTLTVCSHNDTGQEWPIWTTEAEWNMDWFRQKLMEPPADVDRTPWYTRPGQAVCMLGTKTPHWRMTLECEPGQSVIQHFYHWKILTEAEQ